MTSLATFGKYRSRQIIEAKERPERGEFVTRDGKTISSEHFHREWEKLDDYAKGGVVPAPEHDPLGYAYNECWDA